MVRWTAIGVGWVHSFMLPRGTSFTDAWKEANARFGYDLIDLKLTPDTER